MNTALTDLARIEAASFFVRREKRKGKQKRYSEEPELISIAAQAEPLQKLKNGLTNHYNQKTEIAC